MMFMKSIRMLGIMMFIMGAVLAENAFAVAPSFLPGIYEVAADEDSFSSSFMFEINDPDTDYANLNGTVSGVDSTKLSNVGVTKFLDEGGGISLWKLSFLPKEDQNGSSKVTVTITDGTTPVSKEMTITITPKNDAPILHNGGNDIADMRMPDITDTNETMSTVQAIIESSSQNGGNAITDVDNDPEGIAVIGTNAAGGGTWEYSVGGGAWTPFGSVSEADAVLLGVNDQIRFRRNPGWSGIIPNGLRIKAWDHSDGRNSGSRVDTTNYRGIAPPRDEHPFSVNTELVSLMACPTLRTDVCYDVTKPSTWTLTSMVNGSIGEGFTAGTFTTTYGTVTIQSSGSFTYTPGPSFTCADSFAFTVSPGGGCPSLTGMAFVLKPICDDIRIDLEDAIRALQVVSGLR